MNIQIRKKDVFLFGAILVFFIGAGFVIATGGTPSNNGHTFGEIAMPACSEGQVLKYTSGSWQCGADNTGGGGSEPIITSFSVIVDGVRKLDEGTSLGYHDMCAIQVYGIPYSSTANGGKCAVYGAQNSQWTISATDRVNQCIIICYDWVA